ncbi:MAG TPA: desulfatase [Sphingobacteriaceae bacterium]|nr:desulfatase [Sphingobacteriaceae bacterium]
MPHLNSSYNFKEILPHFGIDGDSDVSRFGTGLINDTFSVNHPGGQKPEYLLQRVNHQIFKDVPSLMNNIALVTSHINNKLKDSDKHQPDLVLTTDGKNYSLDASGNYWRVFRYMNNSRSYDAVESTKQAFEAGRAFGMFQSMLSDLDTSLIKDSIPDFHNIGKRLTDLHKAVAADPQGRVEEVRDEIEFIREREKAMNVIPEMALKGLLPKRVTHGDTKFSNVLFNLNDEVQCVVDLDTVMVSYSAFDFGDAIRTIINSAAEDEKDLEKIRLNVPFFEAYAQGYLAEAIKFLTVEELNSLIHGALLLPYMQAVRFLTDYIEGDHYYKIKSPKHNLQRTRAQMKLVRKLEEASPKLDSIIKEEARKLSL